MDSWVRQAAEVEQMFEKTEEHLDPDKSESETEDVVEIESVHETEKDAEEIDEDEKEREQVADDQPAKKRARHDHLHLKTDFIWSLDVPDEAKDRQSQTVYIPRPKGDALTVQTPFQTWNLLFSEEILNIILSYTNNEIVRVIQKMKDTKRHIDSYHKPTDLVELKSFIGLLYLAGMHKMNYSTRKALWSLNNIPLFRLTMAENRFTFLITCLRFDDKNLRAERKTNDHFTHIREVWELFIANCVKYYEPHSNCTIDKQLLAFRGKCPFKTYMPKSDKYGLKVILLNDSATHYMYNAIPYVGAIDKDPTEAVPSYYIKKLTELIFNTGRNITCDNWFMSIPICDILRKQYNLTMVGTIKKNKPKIPDLFKKGKKNAEPNVKFYYHDGKTLLSYNPKGKKNILILSSLHKNGKIDEIIQKPEIVVFYNLTKEGTKSFNQKCHQYSTTRKTQRWPMCYFYAMLDYASVNSFILYTLCKDNPKLKRLDYIYDLCMALIKPSLQRRLMTPTLRANLRIQIEEYVNNTKLFEEQDPLFFSELLVDNKMVKQKRCGYCPSNLDRKTFYKCLSCDRPMCREHVAKICCECSTHLGQ
ncbi:piggyBac transposable element-derived protein 4 [Solenopsis invicta]|uniref:piggyBac transposable element-derived protein 4 n=1 Tax=Solenopsis invicta TaxID=13686 RepID=UPI00193DEA7F|nr:piggyBac transposable element-derived protein 4 [Solenopsis invicta]